MATSIALDRHKNAASNAWDSLLEHSVNHTLKISAIIDRLHVSCDAGDIEDFLREVELLPLSEEESSDIPSFKKIEYAIFSGLLNTHEVSSLFFHLTEIEKFVPLTEKQIRLKDILSSRVEVIAEQSCDEQVC